MPNTSLLLSPQLLARLERMELVCRKVFRGRMTGSLSESVKEFCLGNSGKGIIVLINDLMNKSGHGAALRKASTWPRVPRLRIWAQQTPLR